jgi:hypothetical protein
VRRECGILFTAGTVREACVFSFIAGDVQALCRISFTAEAWQEEASAIFNRKEEREFLMDESRTVEYPVIDVYATGKNIERLRKEKGLSVRDISSFMGFVEPQAVYKWQQGKALPSLDNMFALSVLFRVSMEEILVRQSDGLEKGKHLAA